jgi:hypothetical protein
MESTYLVAGVAVALIAIVFAWYEVASHKKEIARHKAAAVKYRAFVAKQKYDLATAIVKRLNLHTATWPVGMDVGLFSRIVDIYDSAEMIPYAMPVMALDKHNIQFTRLAGDFADRELFTLWLEGIIDHVNNA